MSQENDNSSMEQDEKSQSSGSAEQELSQADASVSGTDNEIRILPKKKLSKKRKVINIVVIVLAALLLSAGGVFIYMYKMVDSTYRARTESIDINYSALEGNTSQVDASQANVIDTLMQDKSVLNILLMGRDDDGNSDSMMLVSIDQTHQKLKITSFMRDTKLWIPQIECYQKLNAAFSAGGESLAIATLERNFGVAIDKYVLVNFDCFAEIIDILGGVTVTVSDEEAKFIDKGSGIPDALQKGGTYNLCGAQALCHSRNRAIGSDYERTRRQRDVMMSLVNKFKSTKDPTAILQLMYKVVPDVKTDISFNEMYGMAMNSLKYMNYPMEDLRLPTYDNLSEVKNDPGGLGDVLVIDNMDKARKDLRQFIYEDAATSSSTGSTSGTSSTGSNSSSKTSGTTSTTSSTVSSKKSTQ